MAKKKNRRNIVGEFDAYFGAGTVQDWQRLCCDVGLSDTYTSITQCRKALQTTIHVNICDLMDAVRDGETPPQHFSSAGQLAEYTRRTRRIYPRAAAKKMGPVRALLRMIF